LAETKEISAQSPNRETAMTQQIALCVWRNPCRTPTSYQRHAVGRVDAAALLLRCCCDSAAFTVGLRITVLLVDAVQSRGGHGNQLIGGSTLAGSISAVDMG